MGDCSLAFERLSLAHRSWPEDGVILSRVAQTEECLGKWDEALRHMEKAKQLAPGNAYIPNYLERMYGKRRDYRNSDRVCAEALARFPNGPLYYRGQQVWNALARGDTRQARERFAEIPAKFDPAVPFH
jgi:tetratricopeptide (TPR) repeat protein